jgi:hypothetical protein
VEVDQHRRGGHVDEGNSLGVQYDGLRPGDGSVAHPRADDVGVREEQATLDADDRDPGQQFLLRLAFDVREHVVRAGNASEECDVRPRRAIEQQPE